MPKSPTTPKSPPEAPLDLGKKRKLTFLKSLDLTGMVMFGAPGIVTRIAGEPVEQAPDKSEQN